MADEFVEIPGMKEMRRLVDVFETEFQSSWAFEPDENVPYSQLDKYNEKLQKCWDAFNNMEEWQQLNPNITITNYDDCLKMLEDLEDKVSGLRVKYRDIIKQLKQNKKSNQDSIFVAVVDTETTGLAEEDEVISVGIILLEVSEKSGKLIRELDSYYGLREPSVPIHPMAAKVHGLNLSDLIGKRLDIERLTTIFEHADVIAAHNAQFDYKMLIKIHPPLVYATWGCSCLGLRDHWRDLPNRKLDTICQALGVNRPEPHNAMTDCRALVDVLLKQKNHSTYMRYLARRPWMPYPD
jgi:DNA polymerase III epsilon subunit-like protein